MDLWGKYRRQIESDKNSYLASVASYDDALVSLIGDVAQNYVSIRTYEEQIRITNENIKLQQESLRIATARFHGGQVSLLDVTQAQT
ncbi:MAG: TolC family protein, partial [Candidatus Omnitrophota bacterium]